MGALTWGHMNSRSYLHKDIDKIELTPALLALPTTCRWLIVETRGRFSADKTAILAAGLNSEPDMGGAAYWQEGSISNWRSVQIYLCWHQQGCPVQLRPWWVCCRGVALPLSIYGCAFKWECNSSLQRVLILRTNKCPWHKLRSVPMPTKDIGFTQQVGSDRGNCHQWSDF